MMIFAALLIKSRLNVINRVSHKVGAAPQELDGRLVKASLAEGKTILLWEEGIE